MKHRARILLFLLILGGLVACNLPTRPANGPVSQEAAENYATVSALLTKTAEVHPPTTPAPATLQAATPIPIQAVPTLTLEGVVAGENLTIETRLPGAQLSETSTENSQDSGLPCDLAQAGMPFDITIPDDTRVRPGETFSKTWRLVNAGSCTWTPDYAVVWFSGDDLGLIRAQSFNINVEPQQSVDITVDFVAPAISGVYQSNWKLRNNQMALFGIGPNGDAPFWVRIIVVAEETPTITSIPPTQTITPAIFASGTLLLAASEAADLDSGLVGQEEGNDLVLDTPEEGQVLLAPENGARILPFGTTAPGPAECDQAAVDEAPVYLSFAEAGTYLCYRTTEGLPGRIYLSELDLENNRVGLEFVTWVAP